jgi:hypothetical protein
MNTSPILKSDLNRIDTLRRAFLGARIDAVRYLQTLHGGLVSAPSSSMHEVELGIEIHLSTGVFFITWEREDLIEGITISPSQALTPSEDVALINADNAPEWQDCIGSTISQFHLMWQVSQHDCPESLWALRLTLDPHQEIVIALGELNPDGTPTYYPDSLVVIFDEKVSRSYRNPGSSVTAWGEAANGLA